MNREALLFKFPDRRRPNHLPRMLLVLAAFLCAAISSSAQISVSGKVTDETGAGMPGVNILIKNTTVGTTTDVNGGYSIQAESPEAVLVFSFIGYQSQEKTVGNNTTIDVNLLPSVESLSEIVVVGYGTQLKRDITGAIAKVDPQTLMQTPSYNAFDQLKGQVAGVAITSVSSVPGGAPQIRIRGNRTLVRNTGDANRDASTASDVDGPLLVVDGVPYNGNLNDISSNDIASMEVLKDASATAIYGSRGAGGVILITTKRGSSGKVTLTYDGYYGTSSVMDEIRVLNGQEYAQFKADAAAGNSSSPGTNQFQLSTAEQEALAAGVSTNWQKLIYQKAPMTNHNITVSGGNDASKYSMSAGYFKQGGIVPNQDYTRYTIRSAMDHKLGKRITLGLSTLNSVSYQNTPGGSAVASGLMRLTPLASPYNPDGTINMFPQAGSIDAQNISPLTLEEKSDAILARSRRLRTFNSFFGEVNIIEGLKYRANIGIDFSQEKRDDYSGPGTYVNTSLLQAQSQGSSRNTEAWQYTVENLLLYEKTFSERHKLNVTGLYSFQKNHNQGAGYFGLGIPFDYLQNTNLYQAATISAVNPGNQTDNPNFFSERGLISYMARVNYSFDGRYSLTATVRTDGSSVMAKGYQYYTYPAFGAAWNISNEQFMNGISAISNLKLRAGWGITASQNIEAYASRGELRTSAYNFGQGAAGQQTGYIVSQLPNETLKWQNTQQLNIGLDFGIINNRISGAIEVYQQETNDILLPVSLPPSSGGGISFRNLGSTKGKGIEITLSTVNVKAQSGFTWSTDFNYFVNREEITALATPTQMSDIGNGWFVGQPLTAIYDYKKLGIWQTDDPDMAAQTSPVPRAGQIKVLDWNTSGAVPGGAGYGVPDGKITPDDRMIIGNFQPKFDAGMTNRFNYKRFDFSFAIYARIGQKIVVPYLASEPNGSNTAGYSFFNQSRVNQVKVNYWTPTNPTNDFPQPDASIGAPLYSSVLSYQDGSFVKVRTISLGYELPTNVLNKIGLASLRIYASVVNPFIIYSPFVKNGFGPDPEGNGYGGGVSSTGSNNAVAGRQVSVNANNPATRQILFGMNLKF